MTDTDRDNLQMAYNAICSAMASLAKTSDEYHQTVNYAADQLERARAQLGRVAFKPGATS